MDAPPAPPIPDRLGAIFQRHAEHLEHLAQNNEIIFWAFWGYWILFAFCALLALAWVFWPPRHLLTLQGWRDRTEEDPGARGRTLRIGRQVVGLAGALGILLLGAISHQLVIDGQRGFIADLPRKMRAEIRAAEQRGEGALREVIQSHYMYLPTGHALRYLSLGNTGLAADYLWLTSLQYVTSPFRQGEKYKLLHRFYGEILDLDPHWVEIHVKACKVLSALDANRARTERFLIQALVRNPGDHRLPLEGGMLYVVPPTDPRLLPEYSRRAAFYFEKTRESPNVPPSLYAELSDLIGRLKMESGYHEAARDFLWNAARNEKAPRTLRLQSSRQWLMAESLVRVDRLQKALEDFRARRGHYPPSLRVYFKNAKVPLDAYSLPLRYDPASGRVVSPGVQYLRAIQVASIVRTMLGIYHMRQRRYPGTLKELTAFTRDYFKPPHGPTFAITEALGAGLDCERSPLNKPWKYDPLHGRITLPPKCNVAFLYRNEKAALEGWKPAAFRPLRHPPVRSGP